jgi:uncharacterized protein (TIGR02145 family)
MSTYIGNIRITTNDIIKNWWKLAYFENGVPVLFNSKYGALYNWMAATDSRNIANTGWSVPDDAKWSTLVDTFMGGNVEGRLKEAGTTYWLNPNLGTTNQYNFNLRGAGFRAGLGDLNTDALTQGFFELLKTTVVWNTTYGVVIMNDAISAVAHPQLNPSGDVSHKVGGSIRLVKNTPTALEISLSDGATALPYIGNDGKVYRTVKLGSQVWLADNIAETKYRNGDTIPELTLDLDWSNTTVGAMCYFNNDITNSYL